MEFKLKSDYIELIKLLKTVGISETGGHAKLMVEDGIVHVNGKKESRKRAKLRKGDSVEVMGQEIKIL
ncbi:MAG: RNA-binding S4 domain-containing protein [Chlorobi bacterium]|nr:RNA-binding S4 domain-containing protein [Chlorobiota bacterium]